MSEFTLKTTFGDHSIFKVDEYKHKFLEYFINLYKCDNLQQIHFKSKNNLKLY
jgi:hypothetical protein